MKNNQKIITFLTDFGTRDPYVSAMKGVILSICPQVNIIDISHDVPKFNVQHGSFLLSQVVHYFPEGTIHLVVVDPGVGTKRRRLIIQGMRSLYVGPDNGVLFLAAYREKIMKVIEIVNYKYMLPDPSTTFDGRSIFAPVSAHLAIGVEIEEFGPEIRDFVKPKFIEPKVQEGVVVGEVLHVDSFGNIITNISKQFLDSVGLCENTWLRIKIGNKHLLLLFVSIYGKVSINKPLALVGSSGFLEISVNRGSAEDYFKTRPNERVEIICDV